jgi:hypothetical protein
VVVGSRRSAAVQRARADRLTAWARRRREHHWTRRLLPARWRLIGLDEHVPLYAAADYAIRSIPRLSDGTHSTVLALIDELVAIDSRGGIRSSSLPCDECVQP